MPFHSIDFIIVKQKLWVQAQARNDSTLFHAQDILDRFEWLILKPHTLSVALLHQIG